MEKNIIKFHTDADIEAEAAKVGGKRNLREIVVTTDDGYQYIYLVKKPNRSVMQAIAEYEQKKNVSAIEKLMAALVLFGDKDAYEHDGAIYTVLLNEIGKLVQTAKGEAKKL
ncbi:MAG TPA: hypothetical protein VFD80_07740 [Flavobacteriaceae bacterium]|nr:hypothetical protein [Flavobacteriaceae bacterium]